MSTAGEIGWGSRGMGQRERGLLALVPEAVTGLWDSGDVAVGEYLWSDQPFHRIVPNPQHLLELLDICIKKNNNNWIDRKRFPR